MELPPMMPGPPWLAIEIGAAGGRPDHPDFTPEGVRSSPD
jgi:hypothetical protein